MLRFYRYRLLAFLLFFALCYSARCQKSIRDSTISFATVSVVYRPLVPLADFSKSYGFTNTIGIQGGYQFRSGFYFNGGADFVFGERKNAGELFQNLDFIVTYQNTDGSTSGVYGFLDGNGSIYNIGVGLMGVAVPVRIGKIFPKIRFKKQNPNGGLFVELGLQAMHYWTQIDIQTDRAPYLSGNYLKGYDNRSVGFGVLTGLGYQYCSNSRGFNIVVALETGWHRTTPLRGLEYTTGQPTSNSVIDGFVGGRIAWLFPIYRIAPDKFYYF
jgi:hypothetical protein